MCFYPAEWGQHQAHRCWGRLCLDFSAWLNLQITHRRVHMMFNLLEDFEIYFLKWWKQLSFLHHSDTGRAVHPSSCPSFLVTPLFCCSLLTIRYFLFFPFCLAWVFLKWNKLNLCPRGNFKCFVTTKIYKTLPSPRLLLPPCPSIHGRAEAESRICLARSHSPNKHWARVVWPPH